MGPLRVLVGSAQKSTSWMYRKILGNKNQVAAAEPHSGGLLMPSLSKGAVQIKILWRPPEWRAPFRLPDSGTTSTFDRFNLSGRCHVAIMAVLMLELLFLLPRRFDDPPANVIVSDQQA